MGITRTFDEIFDQLYSLYNGEWLHVEVKKDGFTLSNFHTYVRDIKICPLEDRELKRRLGMGRSDKLGSIIILGSHTVQGKPTDTLQIPFKLGFDTMTAHFTREQAEIETCGFEFSLRKLTTRERKSISATA